MDLEGRALSRRDALKLGIVSLGGLVLAKCGGDASVTIGPGEEKGIVEGRTVFARIAENYQIGFVGQEGVRVWLKKPNGDSTDFKTESIADGVYAIADVPLGSYNVYGTWDLIYHKPVVVTSLPQPSRVPDLIVGTGLRDKDIIFYGNLLQGGLPAPGKRLELWSSLEKKDELITSDAGAFAFYVPAVNGARYLKCPDGSIKIGNWQDGGFINFANVRDEDMDGPLYRENAVLTLR